MRLSVDNLLFLFLICGLSTTETLTDIALSATEHCADNTVSYKRFLEKENLSSSNWIRIWDIPRWIPVHKPLTSPFPIFIVI